MSTINQNYLPKADATNPNLANFNQTGIYEDVNANVGIGTTSPLAKLHNTGDFITKGPYFDVRAFGATPLQLTGFGVGTGTITSSTNQISDTGASGGFTNTQVGDSLWILNGVNIGRYTITAKNGNVVTVGAGLFTQNQSNVTWDTTAGVVDSSLAFQNALNAAAAQVNMLLSNGGVVYVPKGTFRIASKLSIPLGVSLVGAGREGTIIWADFAEKTGAATFTNGSNSVTGITGSLAVGDYAKVAAQDFTALARVQTLVSGTATLHVNYYGASGSGYQTVTPVIELYSTNYSGVKELTIRSFQFQQHIGINVFHSGYQTLENVLIENMYVGVFVSNSYTDGRNVIATGCRTGIQFGNGQAGSPDWATENYFYGGAAGECTEYGVRFVQAWGNEIYGMDIGYNLGPKMVAAVSLEGGGDPLGNNTLIGCFSENNDPCIININSPGNNIIGYNLNSSLSTVTYTGTGSQNDMSTGGAFTGSTPTQYVVQIDGTGTPNTFKWSNTNGTSWNQTGVSITGGNQTIEQGLTVKFGSTTGHTTADSWFFAGRTIYNFSGTTTGTVLLGNYEATSTGTSRNMRLASSNLGVGTLSPADQLDVKGNLRVTATGDAYPTAQILNFAHNNVSLNFDSYYDTAWRSSYSGSNFRIYKVDNYLFFSYNNGTSPGSVINNWSSEYNNIALSIDQNGNVGIGRSSPAQKLDVWGNINSSGNITALGYLTVGGSSGPQILSGSGNPGGSVTAPKGSLYLKTNATGPTDRVWVNTNSGTTWAYLAASA